MRFPLQSFIYLIMFWVVTGCSPRGGDIGPVAVIEPLEIEVTGLHPELSTEEIYDKTIRALVWVWAASETSSEIYQGSGVLIDKELRLAVTNYHVTKDNDQVVLFFPVRNRHGTWINERDFYLNESNLKVLERLGYATTGRIVAKDPQADLVIIQLDGLPDTAHEIEHDFSYPMHHHMNKNDRIQILGNPGDLKLWKWTGGWFQTVDRQGMIQIDASVYRGYSGGPVLNSGGVLIGIATKSNELHKAWAVPANHINNLMKTLQPRKIFNIHNNTHFTVYYQIKWGAAGAWKKHTVERGEAVNHWYSGSLREIAQVSPQIRFDHVANDEKITYRLYELQTYTRNFGSGIVSNRVQDGRRYYFSYDLETQILDLHAATKK